MTEKSASTTATAQRVAVNPPLALVVATPNGPQRTGVFDVIVIVVLGVAAYLTRRGSLPTDGLFHDDAWVAVGALHGSPSDLFTVGSGHPAFTAALMLLHHMVGGSPSTLAYPAFIAGVLGPPLLYVVLRRFACARSISALLASVLVVNDIHIIYSGRTKPYVVDVVIVLGLAAVLPELARRTWNVWMALAWVVTAAVVGLLSGFVFVSFAVAGIVLVLHPASDRLLRLVAVAIQGLLQFGSLVVMQRGSDLARLEARQESLFDAHLRLDSNPVRFGHEVLRHLGRIADVFPGGPRWFATICLLIAFGAIAVSSLTGARRAGVRFLGLLVLFAFLGGLLQSFPFGPTRPGAGSTLWLLPVVAIGMGLALEWIRSVISKRAGIRSAFDVVVFAAALAVLASAVGEAAPAYRTRSRSPTRFVESELHQHDVALLTWTSEYPFASETTSDFELRPTPHEMIGYAPEFADSRLHGLYDSAFSVARDVGPMVAGAHRVFLVVTSPGSSAVNSQPSPTRSRRWGLSANGQCPSVMGASRYGVRTGARNRAAQSACGGRLSR